MPRWRWPRRSASRACRSARWPRSTRMSKSGVFAHFGSREELQISVVREYHARFEDEVFLPAMRRAARPAAPARALRPLAEVASRSRSTRAASTSAAPSSSTTGPGRCAMRWRLGADLAAAPSTRAIAQAIDEGHLRADTDVGADAVRDPRPDPRAAPRCPLPALAGRRASPSASTHPARCARRTRRCDRRSPPPRRR